LVTINADLVTDFSSGVAPHFAISDQ